jgi:hypothetical protein
VTTGLMFGLSTVRSSLLNVSDWARGGRPGSIGVGQLRAAMDHDGDEEGLSRRCRPRCDAGRSGVATHLSSGQCGITRVSFNMTRGSYADLATWIPSTGTLTCASVPECPLNSRRTPRALTSVISE